MKKIFRAAAAFMAALTLTCVCACRSSDDTAESSVQEETSLVSEKEPSKQESKKQVSKAESSKPEEIVEQSKPHLGPVYIDSSRDVISDLSGYYASNPDTVGWISVPNTLANDVVVQRKTDAFDIAFGRDPYYLYKDFYGNYFFSGSLFLDYRSTIEGKNQLIHGHSMANGTMFGGLLSYESLSFYQAGPVVTYNTLYEKSKWKIFAVMTVNTDENIGSVFRYLRSTFASDYDFLNYVYQVRERSVIDCPVTVNENDELLTLSTCAYGFGVDGLRLAVVARKVRPGEDSRVMVSDAAYNPDPLRVDIWYNYYGGGRPTVTSFQDALNNKRISWYDGKKKWSAKDDTALAQALVDAKKDAKKMAEESFDPLEYDDPHLNYIREVLDIYDPFYDEANDFARVNDLLLQELAVIENVDKKPEEVLKAEAKLRQAEKDRQEQVKKTRRQAIAEIEAFVKGKNYRENQLNKTKKIISDYREKINGTEDLDIIAEMKKNALNLLGQIQTDEQLTAKENAAKEKAASNKNGS